MKKRNGGIGDSPGLDEIPKSRQTLKNSAYCDDN